MIYKNFYIQVLIRIILLTLNIFVTIYLVITYNEEYLFFTIFILTFIAFLQIIFLFKYFTKIVKQLNLFLMNINNKAYIDQLPNINSNNSLNELIKNINRNIRQYEQLEYQYEDTKLLYSQILNTIPTGIILLNDFEEIIFKNNYAIDKLKINSIQNWKAVIKIHNNLVDLNINTINDSKSIEVEIQDLKHTLYFEMNTFRKEQKITKLITFTNIQTEIDKKETEAWHNLSKVLTHEIMNSVTPLVSITDSIKHIIKNPSGNLKTPQELENDSINDIELSVNTLQNKTRNLLKFVHDFRELTKTPQIIPEEISGIKLMNNILIAFKNEISNLNIELILPQKDNDILLIVDIALTEQILQNVLKNAIQSFNYTANKQKIIQIKFEKVDSKKMIRIIDNGCGIPKNEIDKIFMPFYTTKENGSGIGLPVVKQLMELHQGEIQISSKVNEGTNVCLAFR
jgi:nitrogen fixation/metabolism regulation signal transduction histidine kinase